MQRTKIGKLASMIGHLHRLEQRPAPNMTAEEVRDQITVYAKNCLPSGSGIDRGTIVEWDKSTEHKVVLTVDYHHMDEHGHYDGWTTYTLVIKPRFDDIDILIKGRDRNQIKDYLHQVYHTELMNPDTW